MPSAPNTRIYRVDEQAGDTVEVSYLIRARTPAQAIRYVARRFTARVATQDDMAELIGAEVKIEPALAGLDVSA